MIGTNRISQIDLFDKKMFIEDIVDDLQKYPSCMSPSYMDHSFEGIDFEPLSKIPYSSDESANCSEDSNASAMGNEFQEPEESWDFSRLMPTHTPITSFKSISDYNILMDEIDVLGTSPLNKFINDKSVFELCVDPEEIYQTNFTKTDNSYSKLENSVLFGDRSTNLLNFGLGHIYNSELEKCERINPEWTYDLLSSPDMSTAESSDSDSSSQCLLDSDLELEGVDLELEGFEEEAFLMTTSFDSEAKLKVDNEEQELRNNEEQNEDVVGKEKSEAEIKYELQIMSTRLDHDYCFVPATSSKEHKLHQIKQNSTGSSQSTLEDDTPDEKEDLKDATWYPSVGVSKKRRGRPPSNPQNRKVQNTNSRTKHNDKVTKTKSLTPEKKNTKISKSPENRRGHNAKERNRRAEITNNLAEIERRTPSEICRVTFQAIQNVKSIEDSENELSGKVLREIVRMMKRNSAFQQPKKRASPKKFSKMTVLLASVYYLKYDLDETVQRKKEFLDELLRRKRKLRKHRQ